MNQSNSNQTHSENQQALYLRALVLALGECVHPKWWKTEFMSETGFRFLERLYPRTYFSAALTAAGKAACDEHDKAVGRVGVFHLFRLPEIMESEIAKSLNNGSGEFVTAFRAALGDQKSLLNMICNLFDCESADSVSPGAQLFGSEEDVMTITGMSILAEAYLTSFTRGESCYPYYTAVQHENNL